MRRRKEHARTHTHTRAWSTEATAQVQRASLFAQVATMPTRNNFLINGAANTFMLEAGVRFNLLKAIDRLQ